MINSNMTPFGENSFAGINEVARTNVSDPDPMMGDIRFQSR
jgi:hypothetical protein